MTAFLIVVLIWNGIGFLVDAKGYRNASALDAKHFLWAMLTHVFFIVWAACLLTRGV